MAAARYGPHVPSKKTLAETVEGCCGCAQCFLGSPQSYATKKVSAADAAAVNTREDLRLYVHAPYVVNLASDGPETVAKSVACLKELQDSAVDLAGIVVHTGAKGTLAQVATQVNDLGHLRKPLLFENCCHEGTKLFWCADDSRRLLEACDDCRVGICLDTCHLHASGWTDMSEPANVVRLFDDVIADRPMLWHINDSLDTTGSRRDRHAPVGEGHIWSRSLDSFRAFREVNSFDVVFETPGGRELDMEDVD